MKIKKFYIDCKDIGAGCDFHTESKGQRDLVSLMSEHLKDEHQKEITEELRNEIIRSIKTPPIEPL